MTIDSLTEAQRFPVAISKSNLTIYDSVTIGDPELWIPISELELLLDDGLRGVSLAGFAIRTRSKIVKEHICRILGYPMPKSFIKTQPRFPGQEFDVYVQKSNNLQIWNEEISPTRRYVIVSVSEDYTIRKVKVITGQMLAPLDTTGTLTSKYQASCILRAESTELITANDTAPISPLVDDTIQPADIDAPTDHPTRGKLLSIGSLYKILSPLVGQSFINLGIDQERNRGAELHKLVCEAIGYPRYQDNGQFPDIQHQLLEVKLQTSPTIDLGVVRPNDSAPLDVPMIQGVQVRHCDVRYAVFYAEIVNDRVVITHFFLSTGESFFERFPQFGGKVMNAKLQLPLPSGFFGV
ncbi:restriction endonuclease [Deinococcus detaillensis]|uniref:Restriction endonuclease n=1 Tax=Deinococcus detaillensis TaxID=2592048 RepID=A0A553UH47_9DEIO|nr:restriction endonuclease [Deinococcus detaillensis]TSA79544.1 restriction endonuclease [Deinococcus detaillensis]